MMVQAARPRVKPTKPRRSFPSQTGQKSLEEAVEPIGSLASIILSGLVITVSIVLPVLLVIFVIRIARNSITPQQKEIQRLLAEAVELLRENNALLRVQSQKSPTSKEGHQT